MHVLTALATHPRHVLLFATTAGLLLGPLSRPLTAAAAVTAAALTATAIVRTRERPRQPPDVDATRTTGEPWTSPSGPAVPSSPGIAVPSPPGTARPDASRPPRVAAPPRPARPVAAVTPDPELPSAAAGPAQVAPLVVAGLAAVAVLAGAVVAELRVEAVAGGRLPGMHGESVRARAVVLEPVRERSWGPGVTRAELVDGPAAGETAVLRMAPGVHGGRWPAAGDVVRLAGEVAPLGPYDAYQRNRGAPAAVDVTRLAITGERRGGLLGAVDLARRRAESGLTRGLEPERAALLLGMVLGQDERLDDATRDAFEASGLAHVLAVSGQNVMLLAALVLALGALTGMPLRARLVLALGLVAFYVPLTGAGPSIQRAGVMGAAGLVAALAGRPAHRWYALGLAAAVTLALNPLAAGDPGWQLSFVAVVALLALAPGLREALARSMPGPVADVAAITLAATIGTAPLMALHFEQVSLAALPANLLAAAAIAPIMWLGMLAAAVAQVAPALAAPLNTLNAPLLGFVDQVAATLAAAPHATVPLKLGTPAALALAYATLAVVALTVRRAWRRLPPPAGPPRRAPALVGLAVLAAGGLALAAVRRTDRPLPPVRGELVVSFLDVGQGDATLLQRDGVAVLVDTGPPDGPILRRLDEAGVERLDALVITHAQADHEGAALSVMRHHPPRLVLNAGAGWPTAVQRALPEAAGAARARVLEAHAGRRLRFGGMTMDLLWPPPRGTDFVAQGDPNARALVAHVRAGEFDLLLPADAESDVTAGLELPAVEALKVAHHGSADEGLPALLERTDPAVAAIEVGEENTYGHPAPSTLAALEAVPHVYRTDRDGTVRLRVQGGEMRVERSE